MEHWGFKMKECQTYEFNSASQEVKDINNNKIVIEGRHELIKLKDSLIDKILGRSWYILCGLPRSPVQQYPLSAVHSD